MVIAEVFFLSTFIFAQSHAFTTDSIPKLGYTTISPGGTYAPITITSQYQPIPTYIASASSYKTFLYVSTVIADADRANITITNTDQPITIHHQRYTITHTRVLEYSASTGILHPASTVRFPYAQNASTTPQPHIWKELYEKIDKAPYRDLGPSALPTYPGSGLCTKKCHGKDDIVYQPAHVSEYQGGQWTKYNTTYTYGVPTPSATTYSQPGTYTISRYDRTIRQATTVAAEATYVARASETVTYGGSTTEVHEPCTITAPYGAYSVVTQTGRTTTKKIIRTTTIVADKPGTYTIAQPTTTWYASEEVCRYPTISVYQPGVYQHTRETITVTKTRQSYTCRYHRSSIYPTSASTGKHVYDTATSSKQSTLPTTRTSHTPYHHVNPTATRHPSTSSSVLNPTHHSVSHSPSSSHTHNPTSLTSTKKPTSTITSCPPSSTPSHLSNPSHSQHSTPSTTTPYIPDPSSDHEDPVDSYGTAYSGSVRRGGVIERRRLTGERKGGRAKRVVLV